MIIDPMSAVAHSSLGIAADFAKAPTPAALPPSPGGTTTPGAFADILSNFAQDGVGKLNAAEQVSIEALRGNAGPREVAEAVMSAEQALQVGIAVRDKIVTAYLEISRMAI